MMLTHNDLAELIESGAILHVPPDNIGAASIDVRLGSHFEVERRPSVGEPIHIDPADKGTAVARRRAVCSCAGDPFA